MCQQLSKAINKVSLSSMAPPGEGDGGVGEPPGAVLVEHRGQEPRDPPRQLPVVEVPLARPRATVLVLPIYSEDPHPHFQMTCRPVNLGQIFLCKKEPRKKKHRHLAELVISGGP